MALFFEAFGPLLCQIWSNIAEIPAIGSTLANKNIAWKEIEGLMKKKRTQSLQFWSNFDQKFPPEDGRNRKI